MKWGAGGSSVAPSNDRKGAKAMACRIIIGYGETRQSEDALALGQLMAGVLAARPVVATVLPWPRDLMSPADLERALEVETRERLATVRDRLASLGAETRALADRSPARALYELAEEAHASLIVLGSTHRGPIGRVLPGTVGDSLLREAPCAVAVAPRGFAERSERDLLRVAVAFDGSSEARAALETGMRLAGRLHGSLAVLTVAEPPHYGYAAAYSTLTAGELHDFERERRQRTLDSAVSSLPEALPAEGRLMVGNPGPTIAEASGDFDLLGIGSRGYGPVRRTILGGVSAAVIRSAACPVLVLPRAAGLDPLGLAETTPRAAAGRAE
ncbi:MAG: hypothetical protein GEU88_13045 [Solirubrobacterales bacterium]|nr:hypothetical protein [Solirubrobacterales bacterium]